MRGETVRTVRPGKGRERMTFSTFDSDGHVHVMPNDARALVAAGRQRGHHVVGVR
jgi:hypothetical protein